MDGSTPTKAVQAWLEEHRDRIEIYWLPPYCPSLNLIERLWGHLKRTVLANVLFVTMDDLVRAFRKGVTRVNGRRERMGFVFRAMIERPNGPRDYFCCLS